MIPLHRAYVIRLCKVLSTTVYTRVCKVARLNFFSAIFLGLAIIGMEWVSKVEAGLLGLLIVAQIDFVIGSFLPPTDKQMANGYIGTSRPCAALIFK